MSYFSFGCPFHRAMRGAARLVAGGCALPGLGSLGCGQPLVGGDFVGDASIQLAATSAVPTLNPANTRVGALWLGYSATRSHASGTEASVLPVDAVRFPSVFSFSVLERPPSSGAYATEEGRILPGTIRLARLILFDDVDDDSALRVDPDGRLEPPARLVAREPRHLLLFSESLPEPAPIEPDHLVADWGEVSAGCQLVELDPEVDSSEIRVRVVPAATPLLFIPADDGRFY